MPKRTEGSYIGEIVNSKNLEKEQVEIKIVYLSESLIELLIPIGSMNYNLIGIVNSQQEDVLFLLKEKSLSDCIITGETNRIGNYPEFHGVYFAGEKKFQLHFKMHIFDEQPVEYYFIGHKQ